MFTDSVQIRSRAHLRAQQIQAETARQQLRLQSSDGHRLDLLALLRREKPGQMRAQKNEAGLATATEGPLPETTG